MMNLSVPELLAGLAEECSELAQAALKLRRVLDGTNPTPKPKEEAEADLLEEIADVTLYISTIQIDYSKVSDIMMAKQARWRDRLEKRGDERAQGESRQSVPDAVQSTETAH